ncbi:hypothetical protein J6590_070027 [Homalodisca vitripennis]|nr:hypothetical protein J6590_070027 [Homalodisca vitripennis]
MITSLLPKLLLRFRPIPYENFQELCELDTPAIHTGYRVVEYDYCLCYEWLSSPASRSVKFNTLPAIINRTNSTPAPDEIESCF